MKYRLGFLPRLAALLALAFALVSVRDVRAQDHQHHPMLSAHGEHASTHAPASQAVVKDGIQVVEIEVGMEGYQPARIELTAGLPVRLVFTRTVEARCMGLVQIPAFGVEATELPLNQAVAIEFTPMDAGSFTFSCGMEMAQGTLLVKS